MKREHMDAAATSNPLLLTLDARRASKRTETFMHRSIEKAGVLRTLLNEGITVYNSGSRTERRIIAFALHDVLRNISDDDVDFLTGLLRRAPGDLPQD